MIVYRIALDKYIRDLSGSGAKMYGGRWNDVGRPLLYTASSVALAFLEILVHADRNRLRSRFTVAQISIPDEPPIHKIDETSMPPDWRMNADNMKSSALMKEFLSQQTHLAYKVPSAVIPMEENILIDPLHPSFQNVKLIEVFEFDIDPRLIRKPSLAQIQE